MILALVLAFVTLAVLCAILAPLWRAAPPVSGRALDRAVYRDLLDEIDRDLERGVVAPDDADRARREVERRILVSAPPSDPQASPPLRWLAAVLGGLAGLGAIGLYLLFGTPGLPDLPYGHRISPEAQQAMIQSMVDSLAARLKEHPDDIDGWLMLGRSYAVTGENAKAADAYEHARGLKPDDPSIALNEAEALLADRKLEDPISERVVALMKSIEARQPDEPLALWFLGMAAAQQRDLVGARQYWQHLLRVMPPDAPERKTVSAALAAIKDK